MQVHNFNADAPVNPENLPTTADDISPANADPVKRAQINDPVMKQHIKQELSSGMPNRRILLKATLSVKNSRKWLLS